MTSNGWTTWDLIYMCVNCILQNLVQMEIELHFVFIFDNFSKETLQLHICKLSLTQDWSSYGMHGLFFQDSTTHWNIKDAFE